MAHLEKFKASSCGAMFHHYERDREGVLERDNVDAERTPLNYTLGPGKGWPEVARRIESVSKASKRAVRKDAVVMADVVVTRPQNVPEGHEREFFEACYSYLAQKVGEGNVLGGWVHMDETTPHMHFAFTPILDGRFNFKRLCPRSFYQEMHREMQDWCTERLCYTPEILLGDDNADKQLSAMSQREYVQAKQRLERLRREEQDAAERVTAAEAEVAVLRGSDGRVALAEERTPGIGGAGVRLSRALDECARIAAEADAYRAGNSQRWKGAAGRGLPSVADSRLREQAARARADAARGAIPGLRRRLEGARGAILRLIAALVGCVTGRLGAWDVTPWTSHAFQLRAHPIAPVASAPATRAALRRTEDRPHRIRR